MKPAFATFAAVSALAVAALACRGPFRPQATPVPVDELVNTRVAATVDAQQEHNLPTPQPQPTSTVPVAASRTPDESPAIQPTSTQAPSLLPQSLYFLAKDSAGRDQVWRLAPDGLSLTQVTTEPVEVTEFDVSTSGDVAYVANNQLFRVHFDGSGRQLLVDGGVNDGTDNWSFTRQIRNPRWSLNGQVLAFGQNGVNLLNIQEGGSSLVLPNDIRIQSGYLFPADVYAPSRWSPDGSLLLVEIGHYEGMDRGVFNPITGSLVVLTNPDQPSVCCSAEWAPDGQSIYTAGFYYGGMSSELWRFEAATGVGTKLIPEVSPADSTYNYADWPHVLANGDLAYFFINTPDPPSGAMPLLLVRSGSDGTSGRMALRPEKFLLIDALWSPAGDLVVTVQPAPGDPVWPPRGPLVVVFTDGRPSQALTPDGRSPMWGE